MGQERQVNGSLIIHFAMGATIRCIKQMAVLSVIIIMVQESLCSVTHVASKTFYFYINIRKRLFNQQNVEHIFTKKMQTNDNLCFPIRWVHASCDNITHDIYERLQVDPRIIYVCKICREEVENIKKDYQKTEVRTIF